MPSISLDSRFVNDISPYLPMFNWERYGEVANFRCILCGDSQKDRTKKRGYIFVSKDRMGMEYKCHNCGKSMQFWYFLKTEFPDTYKEYRLEDFKASRRDDTLKSEPKPVLDTKKPQNFTQEVVVPKKSRYNLLYLSDLPDNHRAVVYCRGRGLTKKHMERIVYTSDFRSWSEENIGNCVKLPPADERLVFPFFDTNGKIFGAQGRFIGQCASQDRFKSVMALGTPLPKIFGMEKVNKKFPVLVVEGVIDSLLLPNCVAICGGDISEFFHSLGDTVIVALDNEPRNKDTVSRMNKAINMNYPVVFWKIKTAYKDINDMMLKGSLTVRDILAHIFENKYKGIQAKTKMTFWKKI